MFLLSPRLGFFAIRIRPTNPAGITKYADMSSLAIPTPRGYVKMTEEELQEKIDMAKRMAVLAHDRWMNGESSNWRVAQIDREIWVSSIRRYNAPKRN